MMNDTTNHLVIGNNDDDEIVYQNLADYWLRSAIETGKKHDRTIVLQQQRNQSFIQPQCPQFSFLEEDDISIMEDDDDETKLDSSTIVSCDDDNDRKGDTLSLFDDHPYETTNGCMNSSNDLLLCSETHTTTTTTENNNNNNNKLNNSGISREIDSFIMNDGSTNNNNNHDDDNASLFSSFPELDMSIPSSSPIQQHTPIMQQTPIDHRNKKKTITMRTISPNAIFDFPEPMDNTMSSFPPELVMCSYDTPRTKNYNNEDYQHGDDDLFLFHDFHGDVTQYKLDLPSYSELVEDNVFSSSSKLEFPILPDQVTTKSYHDNTTMTTKRQMPTPFLSPK